MKLSPDVRRAIGMSVILLFGCVELLFLGALVYTLADGTATMSESFSFVFVMGIMAFPFWWGLRLWKSGGKTPGTTSVDLSSTPDASSSIETTPITVETNITFSVYRKVVFLQTYTHPMFLFLHLIGIGFIAFYLFQGEWHSYMLFVILFLLYLPIAVHRGAKKMYDSAKTIQGPVTYTFTAENIVTNGETCNSTMQWQALHKVKETERWFLLYCNTQAVMIIPKHAFASEQEIERFRNISRIVS